MLLNGEKVIRECRTGCYQRIIADESGQVVVNVQRYSRRKEAGPQGVETIKAYPIEKVMAAQILMKDESGQAVAIYPGHLAWADLRQAICEAVNSTSGTGTLLSAQILPPEEKPQAALGTARQAGDGFLQRHLQREAEEITGVHPEGCYYCGGPHPSTCCPDYEER
jgi:hypothetical protein